jgi:hypothetical protein
MKSHIQVIVAMRGDQYKIFWHLIDQTQCLFYSRSSSAKQIIAKNSRHYIQFDEPSLVIDSIRQVINLGRVLKLDKMGENTKN